MRSGLNPVENTSLSEEQSTSADARRPRRGGVNSLDELHDRIVIAEVRIAESTRNDHHIEMIDVGESLCGVHRQPAGVIGHRADLGRDERNVEARNIDQSLERPDGVERGETRVEDEADGGHARDSTECAVGDG